MSQWNAIRIKAAEARRAVFEASGRNPDELISPQELIDLAADHFELEVCPDRRNSMNLQGSLAVLDNGIIFYDHSLANGYRHYCIAHELGHHVLHRREDRCSDSDIQEYSSTEEAPTPVQEVQAYGSRERREREANLFALEFLLPLKLAKAVFQKEEVPFESLRRVLNLSPSLIYGQLATALCIPEVATRKASTPREIQLDGSQAAAARADKGPLLITAGPGTGKTQTLVQRINFLLNEKNIDPERILALTFSNKAAFEMRERISLSAPEKAQKMSVMTFHGYSLELLRKYWVEAGLKPDSEIIERLEAILYLGKHVEELDLHHFRDLDDPYKNIPSILDAISKAKDELVSPQQFLDQVQKEEASAQTETEKDRIEKLYEIARAYHFYQQFLFETKQLDYGELIFRTVKLLQDNPSIKYSMQNRYDAILVDEFQDINRASGVLVKEIAGDGKGLWAVGDLRQSIYRWRGASTGNIKQFENDYPGTEKLSLKVNYRSGKEVVEFFSEFAGKMIALSDEPFDGWEVDSREVASVTNHFADSCEAEVEFISSEIKNGVKVGVPFAEHSVICVSNSQLNQIADGLVTRRVPVLFLGSIFERPEIKDLIALLDIRSSNTGFGLARLASIPEYSMTHQDVGLIMSFVSAEGEGFQKFISGEEYPPGMSEVGKKGLDALRRDIAEIPQHSSAFSALGTLLFNRKHLLREHLLVSSEIESLQRLLAIYQFLNFAKSMESRLILSGEPSEQISSFLTHIKSLVRFGEDKTLFQAPESAQTIDAVRLTTVHKSKGLEFDVVFLPFLGKDQFPRTEKSATYPLPKNVYNVEDEYMDEEECLFFVAMSRAKRHLHLSRSNHPEKPSQFFAKFGDKLPVATSHSYAGEYEVNTHTYFRSPFESPDFFIAEINRYDRCPRQFYFRNVMKLKGRTGESLKKKSSNVIYQTIGDVCERIDAGNDTSDESALQILARNWELAGIDDEPYAGVYRSRAEQMMRIVSSRICDSGSSLSLSTLKYTFENGTVSVKPDIIETNDNNQTVIIRSFIPDTPPSDGKNWKATDDVVATLAAEERFPASKVRIVHTYLETNEDREINVSDRLKTPRREKINSILQGIKNRDFPVTKNSFRCRNCHYSSICDKK